MTRHKVGTQEEWQAARDRLLLKEKELTRMNDDLAEPRRRSQKKERQGQRVHNSTVSRGADQAPVLWSLYGGGLADPIGPGREQYGPFDHTPERFKALFGIYWARSEPSPAHQISRHGRGFQRVHEAAGVGPAIQNYVRGRRAA